MKNFFKPSLLIAALTVCSFVPYNAVAQKKRNIFPAKNNFMAEFNFKPFGENIISFNQFQMKYRLTNNFALRLGLAFDKNDAKLNAEDYSDSEDQKITGETHSLKYGILPGFEYHFLKKSKISPYAGLEFSYFNRSIKSKARDYVWDYVNGRQIYVPVDTEVDGYIGIINTNIDNLPTNGNLAKLIESIYPYRAYTSYGCNLLLGCDFYFMRNLYVGIEAGLGYNSTKYKKITSKRFYTLESESIIPSTTTSQFGFYYNSALRLGFWF